MARQIFCHSVRRNAGLAGPGSPPDTRYGGLMRPTIARSTRRNSWLGVPSVVWRPIAPPGRHVLISPDGGNITGTVRDMVRRAGLDPKAPPIGHARRRYG